MGGRAHLEGELVKRGVIISSVSSHDHDVNRPSGLEKHEPTAHFNGFDKNVDEMEVAPTLEIKCGDKELKNCDFVPECDAEVCAARELGGTANFDEKTKKNRFLARYSLPQVT